jgi:hypothetical protein
MLLEMAGRGLGGALARLKSSGGDERDAWINLIPVIIHIYAAPHKTLHLVVI